MPGKSNTTTSRATGIGLGLLSGLLVLLLTGCRQIPVYEQVSLSRPGMQFSDSPALAGTSALLSTIEPGTDDRGGANASGCTACQ